MWKLTTLLASLLSIQVAMSINSNSTDYNSTTPKNNATEENVGTFDSTRVRVCIFLLSVITMLIICFLIHLYNTKQSETKELDDQEQPAKPTEQEGSRVESDSNRSSVMMQN